MRLLERPGPHLWSQAARNLAHRCEQRKLPVGALDRLVRDPGDPGRDECTRQRLVGGDVQVREQRQALPESGVLLRDRLLHLEQQLGRPPDVVDRSHPGADGSVGRVRETRPDPGALLHDDLMAALDELERPGGRESDAILALLDLPGDSDPHRGGTIQEPPRPRRATAVDV